MTTMLWKMRLDGLKIGEMRAHGGLSLYPVCGPDTGDLDYSTLDAALANGTLAVTATSASGSGPELAVINSGARPVLLIDGEELVGAKQNRIVNASTLVGAKTTLTLPVSCVEAGRWQHTRPDFASAGTHYNARGRQKNVAEVAQSLTQTARPTADQSRVWQDIETKMDKLGVASETRALHDIMESRADERAKYQEKLAFAAPCQLGAGFALGGEIVGLDVFDKAATLAALLPKLVLSYALDALEETPTQAAPPAALADDWLKSVARATGEPHPAVGLGRDVRLSGPRVSGAALYLGNTIIHLSAFRAVKTSAVSGMTRASRRQAGGRA